MAASRVEPDFDQDKNAQTRNPEVGLEGDPTKVLVVGQSQITRIVVARIAEKAGLRPVSETPQSAVRVLPLLFPALVVLDGGADNRDCDGLIDGIVAMRRISRKNLPAVILLSSQPGTPAELDVSGVIDKVVTKPFTADQLQPAMGRLLERAAR